MRKSKSTVVALSTVAALLATGGAAAAVATNGQETAPESSAQAAQAHSQSGTPTEGGRGEHRRRGHMRAPHAPKSDGAKALCKGAPKAGRRIDRLQRRLDGGLRVRGSVERIEKRADLARKAGHGAVADFLDERAEDRRELKVRLTEREEGLKKVRAWCAKQDSGESGSKGGGSSSHSGATTEG